MILTPIRRIYLPAWFEGFLSKHPIIVKAIQCASLISGIGSIFLYQFSYRKRIGIFSALISIPIALEYFKSIRRCPPPLHLFPEKALKGIANFLTVDERTCFSKAVCSSRCKEVIEDHLVATPPQKRQDVFVDFNQADQQIIHNRMLFTFFDHLYLIGRFLEPKDLVSLSLSKTDFYSILNAHYYHLIQQPDLSFYFKEFKKTPFSTKKPCSYWQQIKFTVISQKNIDTYQYMLRLEEGCSRAIEQYRIKNLFDLEKLQGVKFTDFVRTPDGIISAVPAELWPNIFEYSAPEDLRSYSLSAKKCLAIVRQAIPEKYASLLEQLPRYSCFNPYFPIEGATSYKKWSQIKSLIMTSNNWLCLAYLTQIESGFSAAIEYFNHALQENPHAALFIGKEMASRCIEIERLAHFRRFRNAFGGNNPFLKMLLSAPTYMYSSKGEEWSSEKTDLLTNALKKAANHGLNEAITIMVELAEENERFLNIYEAKAWYKLAASYGNEEAMRDLALLLERHPDPNFSPTILLFTALANKGHSNAMHTLGVIYSHPRNSQRNFTEAAIWYERAAKLGHAESQFRLGDLYSRIRPMRNFEKAIEWYKLTIANETVTPAIKIQAFISLSKIYKTHVNPPQLEKAAEMLKQANLTATASEEHFSSYYDSDESD